MEFRIAAGVLLAAFYACYLVKRISQMKKGIRTNQIGKEKHGFVKGVELCMITAAVLVPVVQVISICKNTSAFPDAVRWCGALLALAGVILFYSAVITMRDSWRAGVSRDEKTELVTNGIFSVSRNPAFLGFDLLDLGILLMFRNVPLLAVTAFSAVMFHLQIVNVEEDFLTEIFGEEYLQYRRTVNRYFGRKRRR